MALTLLSLKQFLPSSPGVLKNKTCIGHLHDPLVVSSARKNHPTFLVQWFCHTTSKKMANNGRSFHFCHVSTRPLEALAPIAPSIFFGPLGNSWNSSVIFFFRVSRNSIVKPEKIVWIHDTNVDTWHQCWRVYPFSYDTIVSTILLPYCWYMLRA